MDAMNTAPATEATPSPDAKANATPGVESPKLDSQSKDGQPEQSMAAEKRKYKFQIDGQEVEEEYSEDEVRSLLQKARGADKRFAEANLTKQQTARLIQLLKEDPLKVLAHPQMFGDETKVRELVEKWLWQRVERERMDPKERERIEMQEKLRAYEESEKERKAAEQRQAKESMEREAKVNLDKEIQAAIQEAGLPMTAYNFKRMASYMLSAWNEGKRVAAKDCVPLVRQDLQNDIREMFEVGNEDAIISLLTSDKAWDNIRKADLKRLRKPPVDLKTPAPIQDKKTSARPDDKKNLRIGRNSPFDY